MECEKDWYRPLKEIKIKSKLNKLDKQNISGDPNINAVN